jgi:hypothetical protein
MEMNISRSCRRLLAALTLALYGQEAVAETKLPRDASQQCTVSNLGRWFQSGKVSVNGVVNPPDTLAFPNGVACDFYKWAEHMFLWLTSPPPAEYGPGLRVFDTPVFFEVSPAGAGNQRTLSINSPNRIKQVSVGVSQVGSHGASVVLDHTGRMRRLVRPERDTKSGNPLVRDRDGKPIEIAGTKIGQNKQPIFLDASKKPIDLERSADGSPLLRDSSGNTIEFARPLKTIMLQGQRLFLDRSGNVIESTRGLASDEMVLMAQGDRLVYYTIAVNDVFAYFLTGAKQQALADANFPITKGDLKAVEMFANRTFPDKNVLAVEIKFAWVEAAGLPNSSSYVTTWANVPEYDTSDSRHWMKTGCCRKALLALVGMNVGFSVHPQKQMLWAAFEHVNNTPNPRYRYLNKKRKKWKEADKGKNWLFSSGGASAPDQNALRMYSDEKGIRAVPNKTIGPSNVLRLNPWGLDPTQDRLNTDVISINNSVRAGLNDGDVRKNYVMIGATWRSHDMGGAALGTNLLANSTMETFVQGSNCLDCHKGFSPDSMLGTKNGGGLSHIYGVTSPLSPP